MSHEDYTYCVDPCYVPRHKYIVKYTPVYDTQEAIKLMKQGNKMRNKAYGNCYRIVKVEGIDVLVDVTTMDEFTYEAELSLDEVVADWVQA